MLLGSKNSFSNISPGCDAARLLGNIIVFSGLLWSLSRETLKLSPPFSRLFLFEPLGLKIPEEKIWNFFVDFRKFAKVSKILVWLRGSNYIYRFQSIRLMLIHYMIAWNLYASPGFNCFHSNYWRLSYFTRGWWSSAWKTFASHAFRAFFGSKYIAFNLIKIPLIRIKRN